MQRPSAYLVPTRRLFPNIKRLRYTGKLTQRASSRRRRVSPPPCRFPARRHPLPLACEPPFLPNPHPTHVLRPRNTQTFCRAVCLQGVAPQCKAQARRDSIATALRRRSGAERTALATFIPLHPQSRMEAAAMAQTQFQSPIQRGEKPCSSFSPEPPGDGRGVDAGLLAESGRAEGVCGGTVG